MGSDESWEEGGGGGKIDQTGCQADEAWGLYRNSHASHSFVKSGAVTAQSRKGLNLRVRCRSCETHSSSACRLRFKNGSTSRPCFTSRKGSAKPNASSKPRLASNSSSTIAPIPTYTPKKKKHKNTERLSHQIPHTIYHKHKHGPLVSPKYSVRLEYVADGAEKSIAHRLHLFSPPPLSPHGEKTPPPLHNTDQNPNQKTVKNKLLKLAFSGIYFFVVDDRPPKESKKSTFKPPAAVPAQSSQTSPRTTPIEHPSPHPPRCQSSVPHWSVPPPFGKIMVHTIKTSVQNIASNRSLNPPAESF